MAYHYVIRDSGIEPGSGMYWFDVDFYASFADFEAGARPVLNEDFLMQGLATVATRAVLDRDGNVVGHEEYDVDPVARIRAKIAAHAKRAALASRTGVRTDRRMAARVEKERPGDEILSRAAALKEPRTEREREVRR